MAATSATRWSPKSAWRRLADRYLQIIERLTGARGEDALPLTIDRRRIYVLPTGFGVGFSVIIFVMLMGSLNFNNNMGLAFTFLLAALGLIAPLLTFLNLHRMEIVDMSGHRVHAGDHATVVFLLRGARASGHWQLNVRKAESTSLVHLESDVPVPAELPIPTDRRGNMRVNRVHISTIYPLGLFRAWCVVSSAKPILVYPAPEVDPPALPRSHGRQGEAKFGGQDDFAGIREYRPQDPPRLVAWKAVAKTGELHSKQFAEEGPGRVTLRESELLNLDLEARVSRLTAWVLEAHAAGISWSLQIGEQLFSSATGDAHRDVCLEALALHEVD